MRFREATIADIPQIQLVRNAVAENRLSNPALVTDKDWADYLTGRGKGWVCVEENAITGFAIVDLKDKNIWALFVLPAWEGRGMGKTLHNIMLKWYFAQTHETVWLSTAPGTRAEKFYHLQGWKAIGTHGKGEIKFEMRYSDWKNISAGNP